MSADHPFPEEVDFSKFQFGYPRTRPGGGSSLRVKYNYDPFRVEFGRCSAPFGVQQNTIQNSDGSESTSYSITVSMDGFRKNNLDPESEPTRPRVRAIYDCFQKMDALLLSKLQENCKDWLQDSDLSDAEYAKGFIRPLLQQSVDPKTGEPKDYAPLVKLHFTVYDGVMHSKVFIQNKKNVVTDIKDVLKLVSSRCECCVIAKCERVTIAQGKIGYKLFIEQIKFYLNDTPISDYGFNITDEFED